jgi:leucyl/phenylalanyl-tRNA--protein transferase
MLTWIEDDEPLPPTHMAWGADSDAPGLLAAGGGLSPQRLEQAYRRGIFPWFSEGQPVLWWSPDPRMVLPVAQFKLSKSLAKTVRRFARSPGHEVRIDSAFARVIDACARTPRDGQAGTWILPQMVQAYTEWHAPARPPEGRMPARRDAAQPPGRQSARGRVHSFETWVDGRLLGGLYGVAIGRMFFGESMFAWATDASKIALAALVCFCRAHGITLIDCQQNTGHLASLGAHEVSRSSFEQHLSRTVAQPDITDWTYDSAMWSQLDALPANPIKERA